MTTHRTTTSSRLWNRTTKALGKLLAGMVSLPEDPRRKADRGVWTDYPHFPPF
jgi:hypothetical protein